MTGIRNLTLLFVSASCLAISAPAHAQRQAVEPSPDRTLPLCRVAEPGAQCRTRNGEVRVRRGRAAPTATDAPQPDNFGGGDVGFATEPADGTPPTTNNLGGGDPGWAIRERPETEFTGDEPTWVRAPRPDGFGGDDVGFATAPGGSAPAPEAMECENCDDDEDEPQGPIDNTPRPQEPTSEEPDDEEDCEWRNPAGGPDQEFCDE